jgi:ABC-2 type transport system permease protein
MNAKFPMLIRREFWEHKSLWIAPLVWAGLIIFFFTWGVIQGPDNQHARVMMDAQSVDQMGLNDNDRRHMQNAVDLPPEHKEAIFAVSFLAIFGMMSVFMTVVVFFYLIDCLYTERKDRSILFWKSLPLSDAEVVLSKMAVAIVVVPVGVVLLSAVLQSVLYAIAWIRVHDSIFGEVMPDWSFVAWVRSQIVALGMTLGGVLWYAPIAAYLLLLSAWAKNKVFLWAVLPPIALPILEKVFLGTSHVAEFIGRRFTGYIQEMRLDPNVFEASRGPLPSVREVYDAFHLSNVFQTAELWLGVAAAGALIFGAVRIRRYRDDS